MVILIQAHEKDDAFLQALVRHLRPAAARQGRRVLCPADVLPGDDREGALRRAVERAGCVLPLVSSDLMSDPIWRRLIDHAYARHDQNRTVVIPVLVRKVSLDGHRMARQEILPRGGQPVSTWRDEDTVWTQIVEAVLAHPALPRPAAPGEPHAHPLHREGAPLSELRVAPVGPFPPLPRPDPGEALYRVLFPQGGPFEHPTLQPVRLRICGDAPDLCALPFWQVAYKDYRLREFGWTFEIQPPGVEPRDHELPAAYRFLALAPPGLRDILRERLRRDDLVLVPDLARLCERLDRERDLNHGAPHVLYLDDPRLGNVELRAIVERLRRAPPILLCVSGDPGHRIAAALAPSVPFLLSLAAPAPLFAERFLQKILCQGEAPLSAIAALLREGEVALQVFSSCRRLGVPAGRVLEGSPHLRLDRDLPRALVQRHLLTQPRRVEVVVAYGAGSNLLHRFAEQAIDAVELEVPIRHLRPPFPAERDGLAGRLERGLRTQLDDRHGERLEDLFRRHAPLGGSATPVLWLDFGTFGQGHAQRLRPEHIIEWLRFCYELSTETSADVRLVAYLALEVQPKHLDTLAADLHRRVRGLGLDYAHFRYTILPRLEEVRHDELLAFLSDRKNCRCPPALARELADLIHQKTGGVYEATVAELDRGEQLSWRRLRDELQKELRGAAPAAPADGDEPY